MALIQIMTKADNSETEKEKVVIFVPDTFS